MSAFIVEEITINKIVNYLAYRRNIEHIQIILKEAGYDLTTLEGREKLFNHLYSMNIQAVNQRYEEANKREPYKYRIISSYPCIQVFKAFNCFMYQCAEGEIPKSDLYKFMSKVEGLVARHILTNMPEYDKAYWG
jgi:hypothetical protein